MGKDRDNRIINTVLSIIGNGNDFDYEMEYLFDEAEKDGVQINSNERRKIRDILISKKIITLNRVDHVKLTSLGLEIFEEGGYLKHLDQLSHKKDIVEERETLEIEILRKTRKYQKYSTWSAVISAACAIITIIITIKSNTDYSRLKGMIHQNEILIQKNRNMIQEYSNLTTIKDTLIKTD